MMPRHIFQDSTFPDNNLTGKTQLMLMSESQELALGRLVLIGGMIASEKFAQYAQYAMQGMPALATVNKQTTQDQTTGTTSTNEILSYYINYDNIIYVFHGILSPL
jgi:hypothetical protein